MARTGTSRKRDACLRRSTAKEPRRASRREARRYRCRTPDGFDIASGLQGATAVSVSALRAYSTFALYAALACYVPKRRAGETQRVSWRELTKVGPRCLVAWPQGADVFSVSAAWAYCLSLVAYPAAVNLTTAVCVVAATSAVSTGSGRRGAYSQSSGLYAFRQARSTNLCFVA